MIRTMLFSFSIKNIRRIFLSKYSPDFLYKYSADSFIKI